MSEDNKPLRWALEYAKAGYRVFPCKPGSKQPATRNGLHDASSDPAVVAAMFTDPAFNIGLACGLQPNDVNLLVIDIDAHKGGDESFAELCPELTVTAPHHLTPSGGSHLFFDAPEGFRNTRERLGQGIDTRAEGGYVVVPPSTFPVDGEPRPYTATGATALLTNDPPSVPEWLLALLTPPPVQERQVDAHERPERGRTTGAPVVGDDESPGDYVRRTGSFPAALEAAGWTHARGEYWVRPGKSVRDGHSAVLHDGGPLVIFTTDISPDLERVGHVTQDGTGVAVSLFEFIAATDFGGDLSAAGRYVRGQMPRPSGGSKAGGDGTSGEDQGEPNASPLNLPDEFWESRPILGQIRQAGHAQLVSPDALLINALARSATLIPPSLRLPAAVGSEATFDFMGCVVAESSGGKSIANDVGRDLLPDPGLSLHDSERVYMFDRPVGSGEGIAQAFMVPEYKEDENGKTKATGRQVVGKQAIHLVVDESTGLVAQAQRKGTTIIQTLLSAWSGKALGQQNASAETLRIIDGGRVRVAAVLNMQSSNAWMLFTDEMATLGLTSRVLFASAHDPAMPDNDVDWPGTLSFSIPPHYSGSSRTMTYDPSITAQLRAERRAVVKQGVADKSAGHTSLLRCKVASILAIWDGRLDVSTDDWALAGMVTAASSSVLEMLRTLRSQQVSAQRHMAAEARGETEYVVESAKERRNIATLSKNMVSKVPAAGIGRNQLRKATTSTATKHRFDAALAMAVDNGFLVEADGRVSKA